LKIRLQRAEKSSVFSEWRFGQILSRQITRQLNLFGAEFKSGFPDCHLSHLSQNGQSRRDIELDDPQ
jgi:hypothetical protein